MRERQSGKAYFGWAMAAFLAGFVGYLLLFYNAVPERPSGTITWEAWLSGERQGEFGGGLVR